MAYSSAKTVAQYLTSLPAERRRVVAAVRRVIRANLPAGYRETMNHGMIAYEVPLRRYPTTYNGLPLCYASLAAQKNNYALYLTCAYSDPKQGVWLRNQFRKAGKKIDMGKSCVRFKRLEDLPLDAIGQFISSTPVEKQIKMYEAARRR
jgi:uncharacterized protein YdhG (YjbR/CyaY superfamily)